MLEKRNPPDCIPGGSLTFSGSWYTGRQKTQQTGEIWIDFDVAVVKSLLERHGLRLSHSLGQNFLVNPSVCPKMAALCGAAPDTGVLEVGPGIGVLTRRAWESGRKGGLCGVGPQAAPGACGRRLPNMGMSGL